MRKERLALLIAVFSLGIAPIGCKRKPASPPPSASTSAGAVAESSTTVTQLAPTAAPVNFSANLSGKEVIPPLKTRASGMAKLQLSGDSMRLSYEVSVKDVRGLTAIHLHQGAMGKSGDVVAWLYPDTPSPKEIKGRSNGVVAKGALDASRLVGPMSGKTIKDLAEAIMGDSIYVMVHTQKHMEGELRGQVKMTP